MPFGLLAPNEVGETRLPYLQVKSKMLNRFEKISNETFIEKYKISKSLSDFIRNLNLCINGTTVKFIKLKCKELNLSDKFERQCKYKKITKECPVCNKTFETKEGNRDEKYTCSYSCSNSYFRSGKNNGQYKNSSSNYRNIAKNNLSKKCNRCSYNKYTEVLEVHHIDRNRSNNDIKNLEYLCPTCHREEHFLAKDGVFSKTKEAPNRAFYH